MLVTLSVYCYALLRIIKPSAAVHTDAAAAAAQ
jgi:hypothetical protein